MARKRSIDPDIWSDDRVQSLPSPVAVLLYIGTISQADDEGRLEWSARQLYARVFPTREDVDMDDVTAAMDAIAKCGLVQTYAVNGRTYAVLPSWRRHQYVNRPQQSRLPGPPPSLIRSVNEADESVSDSRSAQVPLESDSDSDSDSDSESGRSPRRRIEGVRLDVDFGALEPLVQDLLGFEAGSRRDGKIAESIVIGLRQKLARHRDRHGLEALRYGLEVARDKGRGVDYACAVAKRARPDEIAGVRRPVSSPRLEIPSIHDVGMLR